MKNKYLKNNNRGYTIIETMIAVSLFIVVVMIAMGALLNANLLHQKSRDMRSIMDNLSFAMEDMSRNLRTGYNYKCYDAPGEIINVSVPQSCESGWALAFETSTGVSGNDADQWVYYVGTNGGDSKLRIFKSVDGGASSFQLTSDEVELNEAYVFSVLGAEPPLGNLQQPLVNIKLIGKIIYKDFETPFSLQTSVSQRVIDI